MATACFWGLPADTSLLMFSLKAFMDVDFISGITFI
jgi:hypothetical protein